MKKMLILNGSHSEISMIREAKKLGYYVITTGNAPGLIGHRYADEYISGDYSDRDKMLKIVEDNQIEAVVSCANDFGIITSAYIGEKLELRGHDSYETTLLLHQKDRFKKFAMEHDMQVLPSVTYYNQKEAIKNIERNEYPVIVKPVDLTGGKGINKAGNDMEYSVAIQKAFEMSREKRVVVEKFIEGTYHSFSTFLVDRKVAGYFSDNEYSFINPYFVATSGGPATSADTVKEILITQSEKFAELLNLVDGVFHMQYVMDGRGIPYIIDITRRCSGDLYPEPVEHATGIPWSKWIVMAEAGYGSVYFKETGEQGKFCGRHCIMAEQNGIVEDVIISDELKGNIYKKVEWWKPGYEINNYLVDKCGVLFWEFGSQEEMYDKIGRVKDLVKVSVKND